MKIVEYQKKYEKHFVDLNMAWLEKYFVMEPLDLDMFSNIENFIKNGAMIYFALEKDEALATCMVIPLENGAWEICKLAASEKHQGRGAGGAVLKACMDYAMQRGARKVTLTTNHALKPALHLYKKFGFKQVPLNNKEFDRADMQFEYMSPSDNLK